MDRNSIYYWPAYSCLVVCVALANVVFMKAMFYDARTYLVAFCVCIGYAIASQFSEALAGAIVVCALLMLIGWTACYIKMDWQSKSLRIVLISFAVSLFLSGCLVYAAMTRATQ